MTDLVARAASLRTEQRMEDSLEAITLAAEQHPKDARAAFGHAQIAFECWQPAAHLFEKARALVPANPDLIRNHALSLAAEGQEQDAQSLLEATLRANPQWIDGHRTLATLRITQNTCADADASYAAACNVVGHTPALTMAWFQHHVTMKQWGRARQILQAAQSSLPDNRPLEMARLFCDSEGDGAAGLEPRFAAFSALQDPGLDLCHVRYLLRTGEYTAAETLACRHIGTATERMFWPYLSLCWRLLRNDRADWLDGLPGYFAVADLDFTAKELSELAKVLRSLHRLKAPYPEQSVHGGTQTDRQLFFHPDAAIQNVRRKIGVAVREYRAALPPLEASHPLNGPADTPVLFEGSWSVRLNGSGYHSPHTHTHGWISSAFYVDMPLRAQMGDASAGALLLGVPPPELALSLSPAHMILPRPGRLVLFPSTLWHGTAPFVAGERLSIAFDIKLPARCV